VSDLAALTGLPASAYDGTYACKREGYRNVSCSPIFFATDYVIRVAGARVDFVGHVIVAARRCERYHAMYSAWAGIAGEEATDQVARRTVTPSATRADKRPSGNSEAPVERIR
jgi:hypothetical protein